MFIRHLLRPENELSSTDELNGVIHVELAQIPFGEDRKCYDRIKEYLHESAEHTGIRYFGGCWTGEPWPNADKMGSAEINVLFKPADILSYQQLERDMREAGFPVTFCRELEFADPRAE